MKSLFICIFLSILPYSSIAQVCFPDSVCFNTENGTFDTLYFGAAETESFENQFRNQNWQKKHLSTVKKHTALTTNELKHEFLKIWNSKLASTSHSNQIDEALQIDLIIYLENCILNIPSSPDPIHFIDPGYLIIHNNLRTIRYIKLKQCKEKTLLKIASLDQMIKTKLAQP